MTDLSPYEGNGPTYQANALVINDNPTSEEMQGIINGVIGMEDGINWWIGDAILIAEEFFPETYAQFFPEGERANKFANQRWVANKIPAYRRKPGLSWSHHAEVAGQTKDVQDSLLERAEAEGWTVQDMKNARKALKALPEPKEVKRHHFACQHCGADNEVSEDDFK